MNVLVLKERAERARDHYGYDTNTNEIVRIPPMRRKRPPVNWYETPFNWVTLREGGTYQAKPTNNPAWTMKPYALYDG